MYNEKFMQRAVELSYQAYVHNRGLPIGCVIVKNDEIIAEAHNEIFARMNPTSHAEMVAIEAACQNIKGLILDDCDMYTTLEPCPMCLGAIYWAKLRVVYFGNTSHDATKIGFDDSFIFKEFAKPPEKRKISMIHMKTDEAMGALEGWKLKNISAAQPWEGGNNL